MSLTNNDTFSLAQDHSQWTAVTKGYTYLTDRQICTYLLHLPAILQ